MESIPRAALFLGLVILAAPGLPAAAQTTYFPSDTTINYAVTGDAFVGYSTGYALSSPTLNLVRGGSISGICEVYNGSTLNVSGGIAEDLLEAYDTSTVNVSSGSVGRLYATQSSRITVRGGTFEPFLGVNFIDSTTGTFSFQGTGLSSAPDLNIQTPLGGSYYTLTGLLQNGDSVTGDVIEVTSGASLFTLSTPVPEASTAFGLGLGLVGLAGLFLKARRRCASS